MARALQTSVRDLAAAEAAANELKRNKLALARLLQQSICAFQSRKEYEGLLKMALRRKHIAKEIVATGAAF